MVHRHRNSRVNAPEGTFAITAYFEVWRYAGAVENTVFARRVPLMLRSGAGDQPLPVMVTFAAGMVRTKFPEGVVGKTAWAVGRYTAVPRSAATYPRPGTRRPRPSRCPTAGCGAG